MCRRSVPAKSMLDLLQLDALSKKFVKMCADVFPFKKGRGAGLPYMCCEKIHSMVHSAAEIMRWGDLINCSGEAAEATHKINVKGPGSNVNNRETSGGTMMQHSIRKETASFLGAAIQGSIH